MKRNFFSFLFIGILVLMSACSKNTLKVTVVDRPDTTIKNVSYTSNKDPLLPLHFIKLPVGSIQPEGWLKRYLILQKEGLTGQLGKISSWLEKHDNAWLLSGGNHGWEEVPYWLKGYGNIAYILKDEAMLAETQEWIEAVFASQRDDGYFGPENIRRGKPELWAHMIMLWCLQSYYEYSGDPRVIDLMTNYFKWQLTLPDDQFLEDYWENSRGGDNLLSIYWLYNITGDEFLLEMAEKTHSNTANWMDKSRLPNWHNVNIAQSFREPASYYLLSTDSTHLQASYNAHALIRRIFGQVPGGMFGADENARMGYIDPRQGTETCGFVEEMASDEIMLRITGDPFWAEQCEDVAFNSYPAAVTADFKALRYITSPNLVLSDAENHHPGINNRGPFLNMNPFSSRCCQHNHTQGWPYYTEHLVMATPDNGLAVTMYGAFSANVKVGENSSAIVFHAEGNYPFEENVKFTIETQNDIRFPIYLRIPSWCKTAKISVNGKTVAKNPEINKYVRIDNIWKNGDIITLNLPMSLWMRKWTINKNSVSINYGPLTFSLLIDEYYEKSSSIETAIRDSKWQEGVNQAEWPSYNIYPNSPWNYALLVNDKNPFKDMKIVKRAWPEDDFPFTTQSVPILIKAKGRIIPSWTLDQYGLCDVLPNENAPKSKQLDDIQLIPMGAARLRISAFPVTKD
ncbi:MAG: hypothetical protein BWY08_00923 [Bacteroidetes bacterium ADurb.Bin174]|nr:MAG: hypothetical protein BWY08_00923 [Bacteroidetes bacterium ADurb.Bin174]